MDTMVDSDIDEKGFEKDMEMGITVHAPRPSISSDSYEKALPVSVSPGILVVTLNSILISTSGQHTHVNSLKS